jgi:hypothetical protein
MKRINTIQTLFLLFTLVTFVVGGYVYTTLNFKERIEQMEIERQERIENEGFIGLMPQNTLEGFESKPPTTDTPEKEEENTECPDLLIKTGAELHLYNTKKPNKEGENPVVFKNLDEYITYLEVQRKTGTICPVLFLQKENDAQGKDVYRARPSPFQNDAGLPITDNLNTPVNKNPIPVKDASRDNGYNQNNYAGFDPYGLYVGKITNVDEVGASTEKSNVSDNPMDPNWGGVLYTQKAVDSGKYDENIVSRVVYPTPKTSFIPIPNSSIPPLPPPV